MKFLKKNILNSEEIIGWALYIFLVIYSALNIASERFGSPDDLSIIQMQSSPLGLFQSAKEAAVYQGRIHQILFYSLDNLGLSEKFTITTPLIKFFSVIFVCFLFSTVISKVYGKKISLISSLFLITTMATTGEYNAINSFPLWFTLGIISFLLSILIFIQIIETPTLKLYILFNVTFLIALISSEVFFLLTLTYLSVHMKVKGSPGLRENYNKSRTSYLIILVNTFLYFTSYLVFKMQTRGTYEGASLTLENPPKSILSSLALSVGQLNVYALKRQFFENEFKFSLFFALISICIVYILYSLLKQISEIRFKVTNKEILALFFLAFLSNSILGFTYKYSQIGLIYPLYLNSLIAYLFVCLAISLLFIRFTKHHLAIVLALASLSIFGYFSLVDQSIQYEKLRFNQKVFRVMECFSTDERILSVLNENILSPDIQKISKSYSYNYFGEKFRLKTGSNFTFYQDFSVLKKSDNYSVIEMSLEDHHARGFVINYADYEKETTYSYNVELRTCNLELSHLTS